MQISFPNMGSSWVAFKALLEPIGAEVILPPPINKETIDLGVKHSPEFVCFPFKVNMGDFIKSLENGVENLITATDFGPCRFGFYHAIQERILRDLGYEFNMFALPQGDLLEFEWLKVMQDISPYSGFKKYTGAMRALKLFMMKTKLIEDIEKAEGKFTCREVNRGDAERLKKDLLQRLDETNTYSKLRDFRYVITREYAAMEKNDRVKPLKAFVTGEIHVFLEPYVNRDIVKKLGRLGCEVTLGLSLYDWILHKFHLNFHRKQMQHLAKPHMPLDIGGEAVWVIGEYIWAATHGYDIFSHIYPFTCMPEITARGIITNKLFKEYDLPPIFVSLDENLAEAGLITRLEAMVELATARRKKQENYTDRADSFLKDEATAYVKQQQARHKNFKID